jgi:hypothetical protein
MSTYWTLAQEFAFCIGGSFDQGEQEDSGRIKFRFLLIRFIASKNSTDK